MSKNNIQIVSANKEQVLVTSVEFGQLKDHKMIIWKKKVYTKEEAGNNPSRMIFNVTDDGETIHLGKEYFYTYQFKENEIGKYLKFYSYIDNFKKSKQFLVFYVEEDLKTNIRITSVQRIVSDTEDEKIYVGQKVNFEVEYSIPHEKVDTKIQNNVKWKVKIEDQTERLIIGGLVILGGKIEFIVPEEWADKKITLLPYLNKESQEVKSEFEVDYFYLYRFYSNENRFVTYIEPFRIGYTNEVVNVEYQRINSHFINQNIDFFFDNKRYTANSYATLYGRDGYRAHMGRFITIHKLSKIELLIIMGHSDFVFYDSSREPKERIVLQESIGFKALLDYKFEFFRIMDNIHTQALVEIDKIVYNANELGNYLWGLVLQYHGIVLSANLIAELGTIISSHIRGNGRSDEPWEQRAIANGRQKASDISLSRFDKEIILNQRLEFRLKYSDKDQGWRNVDIQY